MAGRSFLPQLSAGDSTEITGNEFHHLKHVLRLGVGDQIIVFDGQGIEADAEITKVAKDRAAIRLLSRRQEPVTPGPNVVLATAVPKADRFRWLVEKSTELGVNRLVPLQTARSVVDPGTMKLEKMRLAVIEACKQSGRNWLMQIDAPMVWDEVVRSLIPSGIALIADPQGVPLADALEKRDTQASVLLVVGPEGGFTDAELHQAVAAGATAVSLGSRMLRIETAGLALAAVFALR